MDGHQIDDPTVISNVSMHAIVKGDNLDEIIGERNTDHPKTRLGVWKQTLMLQNDIFSQPLVPGMCTVLQNLFKISINLDGMEKEIVDIANKHRAGYIQRMKARLINLRKEIESTNESRLLDNLVAITAGEEDQFLANMFPEAQIGSPLPPYILTSSRIWTEVASLLTNWEQRSEQPDPLTRRRARTRPPSDAAIAQQNLTVDRQHSVENSDDDSDHNARGGTSGDGDRENDDTFPRGSNTGNQGTTTNITSQMDKLATENSEDIIGNLNKDELPEKDGDFDDYYDYGDAYDDGNSSDGDGNLKKNDDTIPSSRDIGNQETVVTNATRQNDQPALDVEGGNTSAGGGDDEHNDETLADENRNAAGGENDQNDETLDNANGNTAGVPDGEANTGGATNSANASLHFDYVGDDIHGIRSSIEFGQLDVEYGCLTKFTDQEYVCMLMNGVPFQTWLRDSITELHATVCRRVNGGASDELGWNGMYRMRNIEIGNVTVQVWQSKARDSEWVKYTYKMLDRDATIVHYLLPRKRVVNVGAVGDLAKKVDEFSELIGNLTADVKSLSLGLSGFI